MMLVPAIMDHCILCMMAIEAFRDYCCAFFSLFMSSRNSETAKNITIV